MKKGINYWVDKLQLLAHPEGGFYKETYRSAIEVDSFEMKEKRNLSTAIYFLITAGNFSAFHSIKSDEMWHYYEGDSLLVHIIHPNGQYELLKIGLDLEKGEQPQGVVPAGAWFASETNGDYSLVGCTVAPGFDFEDFELAKETELSELFPLHQNIIKRLCKD